MSRLLTSIVPRLATNRRILNGIRWSGTAGIPARPAAKTAFTMPILINLPMGCLKTADILSTASKSAESHSDVYFQSPASITALKVLASQYLSTSNYKNIVLAAPHAGSTIMLESMVDNAAFEIGADVQVFDYAAVLQCNINPTPPQGEWASGKLQAKLENHKLVSFTEAFNPGLLEIDDEENDDEHEVSSEEDPPPMYESFIKAMSQRRESRLKQNNLVLQVNLSRDKDDESPKGVRITKQNSPAVVNHKTTIYSEVIATERILGFLSNLYNQILGRHQNDPEKKLIIFVKDVNDIMRVPLASGKFLLMAMMDLIRALREQNVKVVMIFASSPALSDTANVTKDYFFYLHLLEGERSLVTNTGRIVDSVDLISDGTIFKTHFDNLSRFEKIDVLPPSPLFNALLRIEKKANNNNFSTYLDQMQTDLGVRLRQINWESIQSNIKKYGAKTEGLSSMSEIDYDIGTEGLPEDYLTLISTLETGIWNHRKVERTALFTYSNMQKRVMAKDSESNNFVLSRDFVDALGTIYESDLSRLDSMETIDVPVVPAVGDDEGGSHIGQIEQGDEEGAEQEITHEESISNLLRKNKVKPNQYEKKLISTVINPSTMKVAMSDLILAPKTKLLLQTLVTLPLLRPELFKSGILSRSSINGVLLFGPPGTGKTMLAKAVAKSSGARFMSISLSDIFDKYVGEGEKHVRAIFTLARKLQPCVIFLDEVDALFAARKQSESNSSRREIMNEFMLEWDGLSSDNNGVVVLGATNRPFDLDDAILRRMPRRLLIDLPNQEARERILRVHLQGELLKDEVNLNDLAKRTELYSGSDLKNMCVSAALTKVKEDLLFHATKNEEDMQGLSHEEKIVMVHGKLETVQDLTILASSKEPFQASPLSQLHFDCAMKEVGPSLTDEMSTLIDLRKWDSLYGDAAKKKKPTGWGFNSGSK